jgi:agmatine/peptidylarginine deiminase
MTAPDFRLPAEWEPQAGILVAWPHEGTDWAPRLSDVERTYVALAQAVTRYQQLLVCIADDDLQERVHGMLESAGVMMARVGFVTVPYDDTWLRDSGPITLREPDSFCLVDFRFTGWGGKYAAERDDELIGGLVASGVFSQARRERVDWALEGGSIESDGLGTILTTWKCLHQRHPDQDRAAIEEQLRIHLAAERVLWLEHGYLQGDDTDAHVDTLARFAPNDSIVFQDCDDPSDAHYAEMQRMHRDLLALRTRSGQPYRLHALPWAAPVIDDGRRLAASYANYLVINGAVLIPAYGDPSDEVAAAVLSTAYPGREIMPVPCRSLIWQNGSLHCITMQLPAGMLAEE